MTRRRPSFLILGVCTGIFLLLFGVVVAEVTETSAAVSQKSDSQKGPTPQGDTTILTRVSSVYQNQSTVGKDERNIDPTKRRTHDGENGSRDSASSDESTSKNGDKSDVSMAHGDAHSHATKSSDESDSSSSSDGSRKPRHGEIAAESSGKSTSTKAISEDPLRFSRTNELTAATTKPALNDSKQDNKKNLENATLGESSNREGISNTTKIVPTSTKKNIVNEELSVVKTSERTEEESPAKHEEKKNATVLNKEEAATVTFVGNSSSTAYKSISGDAKLDETKEKVTKSEYKEFIPKIELRKDDDASSLKENAEDHKSEDRDRELTTVRGVQREDSPESKRDANDVGTTASEALDLEKIDEKVHEGTISLINDTFVNYNHFYKTLMGKDPKSNSVNQTADVNGLKGNPKAEVEVVKNVTHLPTLKIVVTADDTTKNDSHSNGVNKEVVYKHKTDAVDEHRENQQKEDASVSNATIESTDERRKLLGEPESQVKLPETTTQSARREEHTLPVPAATLSPVPQGRTIGFSGVNEFPSIEVKSTASTKANSGSEASSASLGATPSSQNGSKAEKIDQKPYPYVKSSRESFQPTTVAGLKLEGGITEETSAYENTIGRGESEKKFIVTEPSVVMENSIQQQKLNEKGVNESTNSTTERSLPSATTILTISADAGSTNGTLPEKFNGSAKAAEMMGSGSNGNDVPGAKEKEKVTARRDEEYDVTGNGITEVSLAPDGKAVKSHSDAATESSTSRVTAAPPNTDIQMVPEEAMMIRSTLDVTESTIVPLSKDLAIEANKSTTSMTPTAEINRKMVTMVLENSTESTPKTNITLHPLSSANQTIELPSTTLNPDESSVPTTTSIEFEFVGLTEAISSTSNATERGIEGRTFEEQTMKTTNTMSIESSVTNNSTENAVTTMKPEESTELPATTEDGTPTTNQVSITYHADNETEAKELPVTQITPEDRSNHTESASNEITVNPIDPISGASGVTEDPSGSNDSNYDANVTEISAPGVTKLPPNTSVTTLSSTTNATKSPPASFSTSTLEPRVLWSTSASTESPDEDTTESIQPFSPEEITFVKIVIEGTLHDICPRLQDLRKALADVLTNGMDKLVLPNQIIIHQNPCLESANSSPTPMEVPLTSILVYVVDEDGKFDVVMTKILPSLYKVSPNFPVRIHKFLLVPEADSGNAIAVVIVSSVAFICLVLLAGLLFIMRKRQTRFNYGERCRPVSLDAYSLDSVSAYNSVRRKGAARASKRSYGNPTFEDSSAIPSHPLNFAGLSSFCNDVNVINEEFSGIPQVSAKIDELPPGAELKNRYANVIPLPETRVPLQRLNNDALTEYINASYVRGPKNATKYYIACQAPIESTVTDFWRMIWEQQCKVIIMLTDLVENGVEKCTEYIPPSEVTDCHRLYGDFQVTLKKRETKEKYAISTLHLKNLENNTFREVFHIWYLWPVSGVQSDGAGLIAVLLEARALQRGGPGPIVVHCSPGTGRTGTLIALDLGIRQYEITRTVDVPRVVYTIRRDRAGAVQTKEQYAFIYKALNLYATKLAGGVLEST
ncbi:hypothetical protein DMN91_000474 [Ooceraea biroi]|uniref:protein-tyrosine-phosphatase n=1 Tax=Ooceraea biroi TaxID=2015173 RepID=A0A026W0A5_OOCBI|nr:uncharacterized protein LOC105285455 [Ooceraea biroi]XP_026827037.1 uncharacterized protein LOC113562292 [Ooceraea biroi]EZA48564.1 Receptor-type tyrosine-protein phosphatase zeta [Ooceraea biroi]RLU26603.1 hypothetical protein DMN91_000399 [Ooceraea biroi]RLU26677.1 hypothetical protein DMN91_000474 [Ooceraea biroi]